VLSILEASRGAQELLYLETSREEDVTHAASNIIKLAHIMRDNVALRLDERCRDPVYGIIVCGTVSLVCTFNSSF
jgi:hypothetical protein